MTMSDDLARRIAASPDAALIAQAHRSINSSMAVQSGRKLQDELEDTHKVMAQRGWGCVYPHARETVGTPNTRDGLKSGLGLRYKNGGNPVDYTGFVNLVRLPNGGGWIPGIYGNRLQQQPLVRVPVVFDAKRVSSTLQYRHNPDMAHQLLQLKDAAQNGAAAFLFVHHVPTELGFLIGPHHLQTLLQRQAVQLVEAKSKQPLHPFCRYQPGIGWLYQAVIPAACLGLFGS